MNNLDVSRYPVQELNSEEMIQIEGGGFVDWLKVVAAAITFVVALITAID